MIADYRQKRKGFPVKRLDKRFEAVTSHTQFEKGIYMSRQAQPGRRSALIAAWMAASSEKGHINAFLAGV